MGQSLVCFGPALLQFVKLYMLGNYLVPAGCVGSFDSLSIGGFLVHMERKEQSAI